MSLKERWDKVPKYVKAIVVICLLAALSNVFPPATKKEPPQPAQAQEQKEDKHFLSAAHHLLKEKVSEDASINMLDFSEAKIPDKDRIDTQGTFDLNGKTVKFWASFVYSTEKPIRLKVGENVILDEK